MQNIQRLQVWQDAYKIGLDVYLVTKNFPEQERFGMVQQMRRAALSIAANIAEGSNRGSDADFCRFLHMARASSSELECFLFFAKGLNYLIDSEIQPILDSIWLLQKRLSVLRSRLKKGA